LYFTLYLRGFEGWVGGAKVNNGESDEEGTVVLLKSDRASSAKFIWRLILGFFNGVDGYLAFAH